MAVPNVIANVKAKATRANVTPRLKNSAPEVASVTIAVNTAGGGGSFCPPASSAAIHHVARNTANARSRTISLPPDPPLEPTPVTLFLPPPHFPPPPPPPPPPPN